MKRIMIYKNRKKTKSFWLNRFQPQFSGILLLLLSVFVCGLMIGCAAYRNDVNVIGIGDYWMRYLSDTSLRVVFQNHLFIFLSIFLCYFLFSFSALGFLPILLLQVCTGVYYGILASAALSGALDSGFLFYIFCIIPGAVIKVTIWMFLYENGIETSKNTAACLFSGSGTEINRMDFIKKTGMGFGVLLASLVVDLIPNYLWRLK